MRTPEASLFQAGMERERNHKKPLALPCPGTLPASQDLELSAIFESPVE